MVAQASMGANKFLDSASIFSVALVGGLLGAAFALFVRLLVMCFSAVWECCPEEESMVVILTSPDEKETPLLLQVCASRSSVFPSLGRGRTAWGVE